MLSGTRVQRSSSLAEQVYDILCESIVSGELTSGDRLVVEQLAAKLGVSQTPVREAIVRLVQAGLATETTGGRFLRVVPMSAQYIHETFLVRAALEGLAAELAATQLSQEYLDKLSGELESASRGIEEGDVVLYGQGGSSFHQLIINAADNAALWRELQSLSIHTRYIIMYSQQTMGEHLALAQEEHWDIFRALSKQNAALSKQLMETHIRNSGARIAERFSQELETSAVRAGDGTSSNER